MSASNVPAIVKHAVVAIHGKLTGQAAKERAISAWNIARARLVEYGYLTKGSENASSEGITLTPKGTLRNRKHRLEAKNPAVDQEFSALFEHIEPAEVPASQPKEPISPNTEKNRQDYEEKKKADSTELVTELLKRTKKQDPSKKKRKDKL